MDLLIYPDKKLRTPTHLVKKFDKEMNNVVDKMFDLMYKFGGIGLAAPQIGLNKKIFVIHCADENGDGAPREVINPEILERTGNLVENEEECLSFPGLKVKVPRSEFIKVKYQNLSGEEIIETLGGINSICFQHENDHLNGKLLIDHLSRVKKELAIGKLKKFKKAIKNDGINLR